MRPYLEKTHHNKGMVGGVVQGGGPEFKPQYCQKKKKELRGTVTLNLTLTSKT
jgi:hypothetical protein